MDEKRCKYSPLDPESGSLDSESEDGTCSQQSRLQSSIDGPRRRMMANKRTWSFVLIIATVLGSMAACFQMGRMMERRNRIWGSERPDQLPEQLKRDLLFSGKVAPQSTLTWTPFVRDEDPDIDQHPWYQAPGEQQDEYFMTKIAQGQEFLITKEDVERMGRDPSKLVRIPDDWGYGDRVYTATFDISHQLHCVHSVLEAINAKPLNATHLLDRIDQQHTEHCLWSMYDYMACHASLDIINHKWMDGVPKPVQDLTTRRQCVNVQAIFDWQDQHDVSSDARIRYLVAHEGDFKHTPSPDRKAQGQILGERLRIKLHGKDWLTERSKRFHQALAEWKATGEIPRTNASVIWHGAGSLHHDDLRDAADAQ